MSYIKAEMWKAEKSGLSQMKVKQISGCPTHTYLEEQIWIIIAIK